MKYEVTILQCKHVDELPNAWSKEDYIQLLDAFSFDDVTGSSPEELKELLYMAISDNEPDEAAKIILTYVLGDKLTEGQIDQLSHEMQEDAVFEEYPVISLHPELFRVNQLLYKAFNGSFPHGKATILEVSLVPVGFKPIEIGKETILKGICLACSDRNIINRLFEEQLDGKKEFTEADSILWSVEAMNETMYKVTTSEYWISKEDITVSKQVTQIPEFDAEIDA